MVFYRKCDARGQESWLAYKTSLFLYPTIIDTLESRGNTSEIRGSQMYDDNDALHSN
jgi:hypothetical protein